MKPTPQQKCMTGRAAANAASGFAILGDLSRRAHQYHRGVRHHDLASPPAQHPEHQGGRGQLPQPHFAWMAACGQRPRTAVAVELLRERRDGRPRDVDGTDTGVEPDPAVRPHADRELGVLVDPDVLGVSTDGVGVAGAECAEVHGVDPAGLSPDVESGGTRPETARHRGRDASLLALRRLGAGVIPPPTIAAPVASSASTHRST